MHKLANRTDLIEKTIGPGPIGPKAQWLRADRGPITEHGLLYVDQVAITPSFFGPFLERYGSRAMLHPVYRQMILPGARFLPDEEAALREAYSAFETADFPYFLARCDDFAQGVGLTKSYAFEKGDGFEGFLRTVKKAIASDLSPDVQEFKRVKGVSANAGILLMPYLSAGILMNYLSPCAGTAIVQCFYPDLNNMSDYFVERPGRPRASSHERLAPQLARVSRLIEATEGRYLEMLWQSDQGPIAVVQSAPDAVDRTLLNLNSPPTEGSIVTKRIMGIGSKHCSIIRCAQDVPSDDQVDFNLDPQNRGYALFVNLKLGLGGFEQHWHLNQFSHAGAIIVYDSIMSNDLASHIGGVYRALDIPIVVFGLENRRLPNQLAGDKTLRDVSCSVFANEFMESGWARFKL